MAKSESSSRIVTSVVAVISAAALAVSLIAAGFAACAVPDVSTKALASAYSTDDASPFTKDELVAAAVQTKHYTIDDNDKAAVYATIAAINAQEALAGTAGKGAPKIDATANYAAGELSGEQVAALETAFDAASEHYVLTPDAVSHLDDVFGGGFLPLWWPRALAARLRRFAAESACSGVCLQVRAFPFWRCSRCLRRGLLSISMASSRNSTRCSSRPAHGLSAGILCSFACTRLNFGWAWALFGSWSRLRAALFALL